MQTVETLNDGLKRAYTITISAADIAARVDREITRIAPQVKMPGFRPGKVPANLVRKIHGESLHQEALNSSVQDSVTKAISDNSLRPATRPEVTLNDDYEPGKDARIDIALEVLPAIEPGAVEGLALTRMVVEPTQAEIDEALHKIAVGQQSFETAAKSYKAASGDQLLIDFEGKVDGVPFEGGKGEGMAIIIGSGQLIPGFEDQLIGLKANDAKLINIDFPADYGAAELAGKAATFDIVVGEVKQPVTTKLDDEFAKNLGLEGLEQLTGLVKGQLEQELNGLTRTHMKRQLLDALASAHDFDVPPSMVEAEFAQIWQQLESEADGEADPSAARKEMEDEREDYRSIAVRRVRLGLLLSEIGQRNAIEVSAQEMNMLVAQASQQYRPEDRDRFAQYIQQDAMAAAQLHAPLYEDKVVDFLFDKATVTDQSATREALEKAIEAEPDAKPAAAKKPATKAKPKTEAKPDAEAAPAKKPVAKAPAKAEAKAPAKPKVEAKAPAKPKAEAKAPAKPKAEAKAPAKPKAEKLATAPKKAAAKVKKA